MGCNLQLLFKVIFSCHMLPSLNPYINDFNNKCDLMTNERFRKTYPSKLIATLYAKATMAVRTRPTGLAPLQTKGENDLVRRV